MLLGTDRAPSLLRDNGLLSKLSSLNWKVHQAPNIVSSHFKHSIEDDKRYKANNCAQVGDICHKISLQVAEYSAKNEFLLILGGDHCIPIGTIPGIRKHRPNTGVIWVDAHADINVPSTSLSGNMHGMPVGFLLGLVDHVRSLPSFDWFHGPYLTPKDIVYIGLR